MDIRQISRNYFKNMSNKNFSTLIKYSKYFTKCTVKDNFVMYESFHGKGMTDSPFAFFKYFLNEDKYKHLKHVWALSSFEDNEYYDYYKKYPNVIFVKMYSKEYFFYLSSSKYLINSVSLPHYFIKKDEQVYINTWHGTPLKTLGKDMLGSVGQHANLQRNFLQTNYIVSPNSFTSDKLIKSHDIDDIYSGEVLENGYPRIDSTFQASPILESYFEKKQIDFNKKNILYAPTWRGSVGKVSDVVEELLLSVRKMIEVTDNRDTNFFLKVHPLMFRYLKEVDLENIILIPNWVDTNELLHYTDILITDYSSIFFDFLVKKKPIIFFMYDKQQYVEERGVYLDLDKLPGYMCDTLDETLGALVEIIDGEYNVNYESVQWYENEFVPYEHGNVTQDYVEYIFECKDKVKVKKYKNDKENVFMYAGAFMNNGITSSMLNLSKNFDYDRYNLIVIEKNHGDATFNKNIRNLSDNAHVIHRTGSMVLNYMEWVKYNRVFNRGELSEVSFQRKIVDREWKRLIGTTTIDHVIDFSGYVPFWSYMFCLSKAKTKTIFQHNDMLSEQNKVVKGRKVHYKNLNLIFRMYQYFDTIAAVGQETKRINEENLSQFAPKSKYKYVPNLLDREFLFDHRINPKLEIIDVDGIEIIKDNVDISFGRIQMKGFQPPTKDGVNFVNIGRLSPEKGQDKLLYAFKEVLESTNQNHYLYIIGSGVLERSLKSLAEELGLDKNVIFVGQSDNAMELLDMCDCFVFSSNHEGQPMTLLESLALGKPVIATNIPGNISVLGDKNGLIVENSSEGLAEGMKQYLGGLNIPIQFNLENYLAFAKESFLSLLK